MMLSPEQLEGYRRGWRRRCEQRQADRRQWKVEARQRAVKIADLLAKDFRVETVCLVGSLTRDTPPVSRPDIDLAVKGLPDERYWQALSAATETALPFELDLIPVEDATPRMLETIREGEVLFDATRGIPALPTPCSADIRIQTGASENGASARPV